MLYNITNRYKTSNGQRQALSTPPPRTTLGNQALLDINELLPLEKFRMLR